MSEITIVGGDDVMRRGLRALLEREGFEVAERPSADAIVVNPGEGAPRGAQANASVAAAEEYERAAQSAAREGDPEGANKLARLAGKMYLSWAESATDADDIRRGYAAAARAFLGAGNLKLAKDSADRARIVPESRAQ